MNKRKTAGRRIATMGIMFSMAVEVRVSAQSPPAEKPPAAGEAKQPKVDAKAAEVRETKWDNGTPKSRVEGRLGDDGEFIRHGVTTMWYENGAKRSEQHFADGEPHGPSVTWTVDGRKVSEGQYVNGLEDGTWRTWFPEGTQQTEWTMERGVWQGIYKEWHPNGKQRMQVEFVKGKRQGPMTVWDDQGVVSLKSDFVDGVEQP